MTDNDFTFGAPAPASDPTGDILSDLGDDSVKVLEVDPRDVARLDWAREHADELTDTPTIIRGALGLIRSMRIARTDADATVIIGRTGVKCSPAVPPEHAIVVARAILGRIALSAPTTDEDDFGFAEEIVDPATPGHSGLWLGIDDLEAAVDKKRRIGAPFTMLIRNICMIMHEQMAFPIVEDQLRIDDEHGTALIAKRVDGDRVACGVAADAKAPSRVVMRCPKGYALPRTQAEMDAAADRGDKLVAAVMADDMSKHNLLMGLLDPLLRRFMHRFLVASGSGGNGKGTIFDTFAALLPAAARARWMTTFDVKAFSRGDYQAEGERLAFGNGAIWVVDSDAAEIGTNESDALKKVATGDRIKGRGVGSSAVMIQPRGIPIVITNENFDTKPSDAMQRRQAFVAFAKRMSDVEMSAWRAELRAGGIVDIVIAAIREWQTRRVYRDPDTGAERFVTRADAEWLRADDYGRVQITRPDQIDPVEIDIARMLVEQGWAPAGPGVVSASQRRLTKDQMSRMGIALARSRHTITLASGAKERRYDMIIEDEERFAPFRQAVAEVVTHDKDEAAATPSASAFEPAPAPSASLELSAQAWSDLLKGVHNE